MQYESKELDERDEGLIKARLTTISDFQDAKSQITPKNYESPQGGKFTLLRNLPASVLTFKKSAVTVVTVTTTRAAQDTTTNQNKI